jgi:hypothetical protein
LLVLIVLFSPSTSSLWRVDVGGAIMELIASASRSFFVDRRSSRICDYYVLCRYHSLRGLTHLRCSKNGGRHAGVFLSGTFRFSFWCGVDVVFMASPDRMCVLPIAWWGHVRGGLGMSNVWLHLFGGVAGSPWQTNRHGSRMIPG